MNKQMEKQIDKQILEHNLFSLARVDPLLSARLASAVPSGGVYHFQKARSGEIIPYIKMTDGAVRPLHSTVDPRSEGARLVSTLAEEGYLVFLGLGGAFAAETALVREITKKIVVVEYGSSGLLELLGSKDYSSLLQDHRFHLLLDLSPEQLKAFILNNYIPAVDGGIRVFPLRVRIDAEKRFGDAADAVKQAIDAVSRDFSVQAYFGKHWFSNIIRNIFLAESQYASIPCIQKAIVCAAGPSLDEQIPAIRNIQAANKNQKAASFVIAADTSLPSLLLAGIEPDAVVSIDCQHISYQHFFYALPKKTLLFVDLASPSPVASRTKNRIFFSGGHPLSLYISKSWRSLPVLDTSGANVTYAAISLAETLGAGEITLFGADFSYPLGKTYARGAYIYPYFEKSQNRYLPLEAQHSSFLYRDAALKKIRRSNGDWRYETSSFCFYREKVEQKIKGFPSVKARAASLFPLKTASQTAFSFLENYKKSIETLESFSAQPEQDELCVTLLPLAAFFRRTNPLCSSSELFSAVKSCCLDELTRVIQTNC